MDFLFGGGVGQSSSGPATASSSVRHDDPISRIPTTAETATSATTSATATSTAAAAAAAAAASSSATHTIAHFNGHDNGPILYDNLNRTSAIDDIRSVVIYIFIITIFLSFFLILPGIRNGKFTTFLCVITSLLVTSIIIVSLNGTTWHVGEAPISGPYKAFSRDRIQGDLGVRIGLQSVNISLRAQKYYILHATDGPMVMENAPKYSLLHQPLMVVMAPVPAPTTSLHNHHHHHHNHHHHPIDTADLEKRNDSENYPESTSAAASNFIHSTHSNSESRLAASSGESSSGDTRDSLTEELLTGRSSDTGSSVDSELEGDEPFAGAGGPDQSSADGKEFRRAARSDKSVTRPSLTTTRTITTVRSKRQHQATAFTVNQNKNSKHKNTSAALPYIVKRVHVDINYNERFYWIGPMQMRREYQQALERGLPYPILTVVEYLSQDDGGFSWSRQYRAAGYYTSMLLWLSASVCVLMFCLHCAAPKYGIYAMQALGVLLLLTNLNYATLVPRGEQKLVIPFEGQSLTFRFGWNFWLVLVGGCLSLLVGTIIVIIDRLFPNFIFTTVLDVDFDSTSQKTYYEKKYKILKRQRYEDEDELETRDNNQNEGHAELKSTTNVATNQQKRLDMPPFMHELKRRNKEKKRIAEKESSMLNESAITNHGKEGTNNAIRVKLNQQDPSQTTDTTTTRHNLASVKDQQSQDRGPHEQNLRQDPTTHPIQNDQSVITSNDETIRL